MSISFKKIFSKNPILKKIAGVALVIIGTIALITPFTAGSWLIFVGLQLLGVHFLFWDKVKNWFKNKR